MRAVPILLLALTGSAGAELPRVSVFAGTGVRVATGFEDYLQGDMPAEPALDVMVGLHVTPELSIGLRAGISRHTGHAQDSGHITSDESDTTLMPLDLSIAAEYSEGRFAVTPWIGAHFTRKHYTATTCSIMHVTTPICDTTDDRAWSTDRVSYGVTASVVAYSYGANRVAAFATLQAEQGTYTFTDEPGQLVSYAAVTLGLAYRR